MATDGWQVRVTAALGHAAAVVQDALGFLPGWASALLVFTALATLSRSPSAVTAAPG